MVIFAIVALVYPYLKGRVPGCRGREVPVGLQRASWRAALPAATLCSRAGCAPRSAVLCPPVPDEAALVRAATYRTLAPGARWRQTAISAAQHPRRSGTCRPCLSKRSAPKDLAERGGEDGPGVAGGGRRSPGDEPVRADD